MFNQTMQKLGEARSAIREIFEYGNNEEGHARVIIGRRLR